MQSQRFLGSAYAMVHGPAEPRALAIWVLERGFGGIVPAPGPRALDWRHLKAACANLPVEFVAVRTASVLEIAAAADGSLASTHAGDRAAASQAVNNAVGLALRLGCSRVILDPGTVRVSGESGPLDLGDPTLSWTQDRAKAQIARRNAILDAALDAACRSLFDCVKRHPDLELCLTPSRHVFGLGEPRALAAIFEDLGPRLRYWHDTAVAARREQLLGTPQGEWLEQFGSRMVGMTVADSADGMVYLAPGAGTADFPLIAAYGRRVRSPLPVVLELDPGAEPGELPGIRAFLDKYGL